MQQQSDIHLNIQKFPLQKRPEGLIHHPQEQQFLAVQKIEQVIGLREKYITQETKNKQFYLFDGRAWEPLDDTELKIDCSHPLTKEEMQHFSEEDPYIVISGKLAGLVEMTKKTIPMIGDLKEIALSVGHYLEGYLNEYNYVLLFKRNLKDMINNDKYKPVISADKKFKQQLNKLLNKDNDIFNEVEQLMSTYQKNSPETEFKKSILSEYKDFSEHYQERKYYADLKTAHSKMRESALSYNKRAVQDYQAKKYEAAANLFLEAVKICTSCCMKNDPALASAYFNCGRSLYQAERYQEAYFFLNTSLQLRENYTQPKPSKQEIEKTQSALNECAEKLEKQPTNNLGNNFSV